MKINVNLASRSFLFIDDFSLTRSQGLSEVDLSTRGDAFISSLVIAIGAGIVECDHCVEDVANQIQDSYTRNVCRINVGLSEMVDIATIDKKDISKVVKPKAPKVTEPAEEVEVESAEEGGVSESVLTDLLEMSTSKIMDAIDDMNLSTNDVNRMMNIEKKLQNRSGLRKAVTDRASKK